MNELLIKCWKILCCFNGSVRICLVLVVDMQLQVQLLNFISRLQTVQTTSRCLCYINLQLRKISSSHTSFVLTVFH